MRTETLTYLKENANRLEVNEPLVITQNGKAKYVVQDVDDYEFQQESLALLKLLTLAEHSAQKETLSLDEVFGEE
ncbi:type II toxin-antitoxin system Phd/YefM family antitoxin [Aliikangiella sp. G2MR2-5]|uniref:type II toxin-antitoxin system Phd/YefM family antitoxin n=1 Tax=Aliikangiella sp. G2MR2-5 TaxID=2788943 RepID=UPI0018AB1791|nr:type II toxin-antitoxin system Phd/YefM family antitoxin [Aliikangiella sp. G2MR2-5]